MERVRALKEEEKREEKQKQNMSGLDKHWEQIYRDKGNRSDAAVGERMSNM